MRRWRVGDRRAAAWDNIQLGVLRYDVLTCRPDGSEAVTAVPAHAWEHGGHHINWLPDSSALSMNLGGFGSFGAGGGGLRFARVGIDGSGLRPLLLDVRGSGHPTVHECGRILTDSYTGETPFARPDGTTPLRWVSLRDGTEVDAVRMTTAVAPGLHGALRVDPHPAWDHSRRRVVFNAVIGGTRRVMVADFGALIDAE